MAKFAFLFKENEKESKPLGINILLFPD